MVIGIVLGVLGTIFVEMVALVVFAVKKMGDKNEKV